MKRHKRHRWYPVWTGTAVLLLIMALVGLAALGCGSDADDSGGPLKLDESNNGEAYTVKVGDTIEVATVGNPTTGYEWTAALSDEDAKLLEQVGDADYVTDPTESEMVGVGGTYTFTFKAVAQGEAALKLVYARPWESEPPLATFEVTVTIE